MQNCIVCTKKGLWQASSYWTDNQRWWQCRNCGHWQLEVPPQGLKIPPKILYVDIETALMKVYIYDLFENGYISPKMIDKRRFVICWQAAWLDMECNILKRMRGVLTPKEVIKENDKRILEPLFDLMDEAQYVCGHNLKRFDRRMLNWRFLKHGMNYPTEYKVIDSYMMANADTKPESKGLEYLSEEFGGTSKRGLTREEWREIVEKGTQRLLNKADRYCRGDVTNGILVLKRFVDANQSAGKIIFK